MKKLLAISLLFLYIFGATEACQLFKVPAMIMHYVEHKAENPSITVYQFFKIHYFDDTVHDSDYQHDQRLPFKVTDNHSTSLVCVVPGRAVIQAKVKRIPLKKYTIFNTYIPSNLFDKGIFQPPKLA